jgi:hypothetical protein
MKKFILFYLLTSILYLNTPAQTTLGVGDASLLWIDLTTPDDFGFVSFVDLEVNTQIYFTDNGASDIGTFDTGEGVIEFIVNTFIPAGTIIQYNDATFGSWSTIAGSLAFSSSGDQLFIFQDGDGVGGSLPQNNPVFIHAVNAASRDKNDSCDFTDSQQTNSPSTLTPVTFGDGTGTFLALGTGTGCDDENDYLHFTGGSDFTDIATAKAAIQDPDNWLGGGSPQTSADATYTDAIAAFLADMDGLLPVEWVSFNARVERSEILLNWQTATEVNNDKFVIEYSRDGRNFQAIGEVAGRGFSDELAHYQFVHSDPQRGVHYYRLKQIDFDGEFEYSKIVSIVYNREGSIAVKLWPNPSSDGSVQLEWHGLNQQDDCIVQLFNGSGQLMQQTAYPFEKNENRISFDWSHLSNGIYFVKLQVGNESLYHKIHLQH